MNKPEITPDQDPEADAIAIPEDAIFELPGQDALLVDPVAAQQVHPSPFLDIISGQFDAEDAGVLDEPMAKRVLAPQVETPKLHKVLAQSGMGSRLEM